MEKVEGVMVRDVYEDFVEERWCRGMMFGVNVGGLGKM